MFINIYRFLPITKVEGFGVRSCIWVQGCPIRCNNCGMKETWDENKGTKISVEDLFKAIKKTNVTEGVTFLGGEPFAQAKALSKLGYLLQNEGYSIITFTGYEIEYIRSSGNQNWIDLLSCTDLLIDGQYKKELMDFSRPWVGSSNKRFHFLSSKYKDMEKHLNNIKNKIEIKITPNGEIFINGMANTEDIKGIIDTFVTINNKSLI